MSKRGDGFKIAMSGLDGGRLLIGACSLGAADACLEILLNWLKVRWLIYEFLIFYYNHRVVFLRESLLIKPPHLHLRICMESYTSPEY
jgi:hypothetical protein